MRNTRNYRPPFLYAAAVRRGEGRRTSYVDVSCDFVAARDVQINGVTIEKGAPFDKTIVTERRLRQLYDARSIALAPGSAPVASPPRPLAIGPTDFANPNEARPPKKTLRRGIVRRAA